MPYIDEKYDRLALSDKYLEDPLLLALAWKKAHAYVRTTNWYADNFELDKSALNLAECCRKWASEIEEGELSFAKLELVPAPKSAEWTFTERTPTAPPTLKELLEWPIEDAAHCYCLNWEPEAPNELKLRPLAHIGIKEQTLITLVMMCLANDVEAIQGDPATAYEEVHENKVVSYGNRLYCTYSDDGKAEHNYGATSIYSKFFTDYRKFLQRPYYFAAKALPEKSPDEELYLVDLDLSQFFDLIDRDILVNKILYIAKDKQETTTKDQILLNKLLQAFKGWEWSESAKASYYVCKTDKVETPPDGLPQGLVASGFLSNIYMLDFDTYMASFIGHMIPAVSDLQLKLVDYCRYVDDMRLVIVGPRRTSDDKNPINQIKDAVNTWLNPKLEKLKLILNQNKAKAEVYRGKSKGISATLEDVQTRASGPISFEDADELLSQLESLLLLSGGKAANQIGEGCSINRLALIEKSVFDIREDTLKRFAANKIARMLNEKRHFTSREVDDNGLPVPGDWDYLQERMARRLVACWSHDPALVLLLKKGLELFPSPKLLEPVLEQIRHVIHVRGAAGQPPEHLKQAAVAKYCLSEVFRHSATVIHRRDRQAIPAHADIDTYFEILQNEAAKWAPPETETSTFDLLQQQARFLLMVRLDTVLENSCGDREQDLIFKLAKGFRNIALDQLKQQVKDKWEESVAACILIANQLVEDQKPVIRATSCLLESNVTEAEDILTRIALQEPGFVRSLFRHARSVGYEWFGSNKPGFVSTLSNQLYLDVKPSTKPLKDILDPIAIYKLSSRPDSPLANEVMSLKLLLALCDKSGDISKQLKADKNQVIDLSKTKIKLIKADKPIGMNAPPKFDVFDARLEVIEVKTLPALADLAGHLSPQNDEPLVLQRIALAMRAVLSGSADPTGFGQSFEPRAGYRGIKSTSYKRQFGMMTTPESLAGESAQFSSWLTTLLAKLLRWPGIHVNEQGFDWPVVLTLEAVKKLAKARLEMLKDSYCQLSKIPVLPELITPAWNESKKSLTVAMVQSKLPMKADFSSAGVYLDDAQYRVRHRRHVARVAQLAIQHIQAQHIDKPKDGKREEDIDLIVWPELSVHKDDLDILVQLSRKTHAIVFAGLVFIDQPGVPGPNNCAVWIVPRKHNGNQNEIKRYQGKFHMMEEERTIKIQPWRPYQLMLELKHPKFKDKPGFRLTGAICFDATDIALSADLRDKSNAFIVSALNRDVNSFDNMVEALQYHMYQPVVLVNTGEFGSSYAMAPYDKPHKRLIAHSTGNNQVAINSFEMNMFDFRRDGVGKSMMSGDDTKTPPAGIPTNDSHY